MHETCSKKLTEIVERDMDLGKGKFPVLDVHMKSLAGSLRKVMGSDRMGSSVDGRTDDNPA